MFIKSLIGFCILFIVSCNSRNLPEENSSPGKVNENDTVVAPSIKMDYDAAIAKLSADDPEQIGKAIALFKDNFRPSPSLQNDSAVFAFIQFFRKATNNAAAYYNSLQQVNSKKTSSKDSAAFAQLALANGLRFANAEGMAYLKADYGFAEQEFQDYVTAPVQQFLRLLAQHHAQPLLSDASIVPRPAQFTQRLMNWHNFNAKNTAHVFATDARRIEKEIYTLYLRGVDNSPVYDGGSKTLTTFFNEAYTFLDKNFSGSGISNQVKPYSDLLKAGDEGKAGKLLQEYTEKGLIYPNLMFEDAE